MAGGNADSLRWQIRMLLATEQTAPTNRPGTAGALARERDEEAFAALVHRHGPMVLRVCRSVLGHEQDAEDGFQATFLVLARKAAALSWQESIAGWLYETARRLAREAARIACSASPREPGRPTDHCRSAGGYFRTRPAGGARRGIEPVVRQVSIPARSVLPRRSEWRDGRPAAGLLPEHAQTPTRQGAAVAPRPTGAARPRPVRSGGGNPAPARRRIRLRTANPCPGRRPGRRTLRGRRRRGGLLGQRPRVDRSRPAGLSFSKGKTAVVVLSLCLVLSGAGLWAHQAWVANEAAARKDPERQAARPVDDADRQTPRKGEGPS